MTSWLAGWSARTGGRLRATRLRTRRSGFSLPPQCQTTSRFAGTGSRGTSAMRSTSEPTCWRSPPRGTPLGPGADIRPRAEFGAGCRPASVITFPSLLGWNGDRRRPRVDASEPDGTGLRFIANAMGRSCGPRWAKRSPGQVRMSRVDGCWIACGNRQSALPPGLPSGPATAPDKPAPRSHFKRTSNTPPAGPIRASSCSPDVAPPTTVQ